jgi:hypothetical protein
MQAEFEVANETVISSSGAGIISSCTMTESSGRIVL